MADVLFFIKQGWKVLWKQDIIWIFSALPMINLALRSFVLRPDLYLIDAFLLLAENLLAIVLFIASNVGVPFIVYCTVIEKTVNIREVISAVRKFAWRTIGCSCLTSLVTFPSIAFFFFITKNATTDLSQLSFYSFLVLGPIAVSLSVLDFTLFEFFANDSGIRISFNKAWELFADHFGALVMLGLGLGLMLHIYSIFCAGLVTLVESGFDYTALGKINIYMPSTILSQNPLFSLLYGVGQMIYTPYSASIFAVAYWKYKAEKRY